MTKYPRILPWLLTLLWMGIIFGFSHQPDSGVVTERYLGTCNVPIRKLAHLTEYFVLFGLMRWSLATTRLRNISVLALVFSILFAVSDECHQTFVPGRSATLGDVLVDATGALLACLIFSRICSFKRSSPNLD